MFPGSMFSNRLTQWGPRSSHSSQQETAPVPNVPSWEMPDLRKQGGCERCWIDPNTNKWRGYVVCDMCLLEMGEMK